eukprot:m.452141 g.452141  ORF g.452141 m.452141 type:complete len:110 (-) comp56925_c0_seq10:1032-1361(-)
MAEGVLLHLWELVPGLTTQPNRSFSAQGILYTITDVVDLHVWMASHLDKHPLFQRLTDEELAADPVIPKLYSSSEEGKKVIRNMEKGQNHGDGDVRLAVYRRIADPFQA